MTASDRIRNPHRNPCKRGPSTYGSLAEFIRKADEKLATYLKRLDDCDTQEDDGGSTGVRSDSKLKEKIAAIQGKRDRHKAMLATWSGPVPTRPH